MKSQNTHDKTGPFQLIHSHKHDPEWSSEVDSSKKIVQGVQLVPVVVYNMEGVMKKFETCTAPYTSDISA